MGERDDARRSIEDARERMSAIAEELARRASPGYVKDRAREAAVRKTSEYREKAMASPGAWSLLGGVLGATAGAVAGRQFRQRSEIQEAGDRYEPAVKSYEYGYSSPSGYNPETSLYGAAPVSGVPEYGKSVAGPGEWENLGGEPSRGEQLRGKAEELKHQASDRASEFKQRASEKAGGVKERLRETSHRARERLPDVRNRATNSFQRQLSDQPLLLALGAIGVGLLASMLLPVSNRERQLAAPAKSKMRERIENVESRLESRVEGDSGREPGRYDASSSDASRPPSASSAPYFGEDSGVVEEESRGSFLVESDESSGRTIH